jgi:hypothetical protein
LRGVSAVRSSATPDHLAVIQRGHPASGGHVLDGTQTGFGPTGAHVRYCAV